MDTYYGYYGWGWGGFRDVIAQWQQVGLFDVILPLLLIFAVVYSILEKIKIIGDNKAANVIVAAVLAFFAVSNLYVSGFFMVLFQYTGVAIAVLIAVIVLLGLFAQGKDDRLKWILGVSGFALLIWVLSRAFSDYGVVILSPEVVMWISYNIYWILPILFIAGAIIVVITASGNKDKSFKGFSLTPSNN